MTVKDLEILYDYGCWTNKKLFHVIAQLTPEEFTRSLAGSYGSIRNTMVHILRAEWEWLSRCGGEALGTRLDPEDYPSVESLMETWASVEGYVRVFLSRLKDEDLVRNVEYVGGGPEKRTMPIGELMHHVFNHGAHHRGQVALLLRQLGYTPGDFDLLFYYAERRGVSAW